MGLKIGDKVKFLNDEGGGKITQLIDMETAMVLTDIADFEIPVLIRELIPLEVSQSSLNQSNNSVVSEEQIGLRKGLILMFAQKKDAYICYLFNGKEQAFLMGVFEENTQRITGVYSGIVQPQSLQEIGTYSLKDFEIILKWRVQGFYYERYMEKVCEPLDCRIKIHPKKLFSKGRKEYFPEFGKEVFVFDLEPNSNKNILQAEELFVKESAPTVRVSSKRKKTDAAGLNSQDFLEVDLHIQELLETTQGMSNKDMIDYQLDVVRRTLEENKKHKGKRIVFIHGVGNGILKQRIRHELQKYPRYVVQDASFQQYGWGATMIIIK